MYLPSFSFSLSTKRKKAKFCSITNHAVKLYITREKTEKEAQNMQRKRKEE